MQYRNIYRKYKRQEPKKQGSFYEARRMELAHYEAAGRYLQGVMNGKTTLPKKAWKAEYANLTAERDTLNQRCTALKDEVKEAEQIRKSVYSILRQEQREQQPRKTQGIPTVLSLPIPGVSVNTRKGVVVNYAPCELAV